MSDYAYSMNFLKKIHEVCTWLSNTRVRFKIEISIIGGYMIILKLAKVID